MRLPARRTHPFRASGEISLISRGEGTVAPLSAARAFVPEELYSSVTLLAGEDTPGFLTPDQSFAGKLAESDWESLRGVDVRVAHNSWFTADVPKLLTEPGTKQVPIIGLAWGAFDLSNAEGDFYQGSYTLLIGGPAGGSLTIDSSCDPNPALSKAVSDRMGDEVAVRAAIVGLTDIGKFASGPKEAQADFQQLGSDGIVTFTAQGCLDHEAATFAVKTVRQME
jgi:hypothetical protein